MSYGDACKRVGVAPVANLKAPTIPKSKIVEPFQAVSGQLGQLDGVDRDKWQTHAAKLVTWGTECLLRAPEHMAWLAARAAVAAFKALGGGWQPAPGAEAVAQR